MNSWIFYFTDSMSSMVAVVGSGETREEGEAAALSKWDTAASLLDDYAERSPIMEIVYSGLSTELDGDLPGLLL